MPITDFDQFCLCGYWFLIVINKHNFSLSIFFFLKKKVSLTSKVSFNNILSRNFPKRVFYNFSAESDTFIPLIFGQVFMLFSRFFADLIPQSTPIVNDLKFLSHERCLITD